MTKDEALKLALEFIERVNKDGWILADFEPQMYQAIACLRLVIDAENISSKPMAWEQFYPEMGKPKLAYLSPTESPENACYIPPQRTWVGLTDEEIKRIGKLDLDSNYFGLWYDFAKAIEAKLKEKNNG
jgi:hypothetical protein